MNFVICGLIAAKPSIGMYYVPLTTHNSFGSHVILISKEYWPAYCYTTIIEFIQLDVYGWRYMMVYDGQLPFMPKISLNTSRR